MGEEEEIDGRGGKEGEESRRERKTAKEREQRKDKERLCSFVREKRDRKRKK